MTATPNPFQDRVPPNAVTEYAIEMPVLVSRKSFKNEDDNQECEKKGVKLVSAG
jgi:hypothetical protein